MKGWDLGPGVCWLVGLLNVPATCQCISGTDLLRQFFVLPHSDKSCRSNFPSHPVTVYWHRANQSQHWPYYTRRLAGLPIFKSLVWLDREQNPGGHLNHWANEVVGNGSLELTYFLAVSHTQRSWYTKGWDLRPGVGQPLGSGLSKRLSSKATAYGP